MAFIKPEVYAPIVSEKLKERMVVANLAVDLGLLKGDVGETVNFPVFKRIGDAKEMGKGDGINEVELQQEQSSATIKHISAPGVVIYDIENKTALGNQVTESAKQQGESIARFIDLDCISELEKTTLKKAVADPKGITVAELNEALMLFGDEQDTDSMDAIVINSLLSANFYGMAEFVDATKTYNRANTNGIVKGGVIGYFRGIPVIMSDHGTLDKVNTECKTFILKKGCLGKMFKSDKKCDIEVERQAKFKRTAVYTDSIYAVKLLDSEGVVMLKKTIA